MKSNKDNLEVIYEDNHLIAVNKRSGDLSQKDNTGEDSLIEIIKEYLKEKYNKPGNVYLGSIHRLDQPTSGLIIFAKTSKGLSRMTELIRNKGLNKTYLAVVDSHLKKKEGRLKHLLLKNEKQNKSYISKDPKAKEAILEYEVLTEKKGFYLLKIRLITGRHHQIRVQLSAMGYPIVGDLKYGSKQKKNNGEIGLHSFQTSFNHPIKKEEIKLVAKRHSNGIWHNFNDTIRNLNN